MNWRNFQGQTLDQPIRQSVEEVIRREHEAGNRLKVCIGTDSQVKAGITEFATVIVFLREGRGGFMFIHNEESRLPYSIKERMLLEVAKSIEIAYELCDLFTTYQVAMEVPLILIPILNSRAMRLYVKLPATYLAWDLLLKPNRRRLRVAAVPIKW